jgi:hypothetical protein
VAGRWKIIVATTIAAALYAGSVAGSPGPFTLAIPVGSDTLALVSPSPEGLGISMGFDHDPARLATAGATLRGLHGWTASLFVSYLGPRQASEDSLPRLRSSSVVNARLVRNLSKTTRLTFDVFNVFDRPVAQIDQFAASRLAGPEATHENFLFHPAEPRGLRLRLRTTF